MLLDHIQPRSGKGLMATFMHQILLPWQVLSLMTSKTQLRSGGKVALSTLKPFLRFLWLCLWSRLWFHTKFDMLGKGGSVELHSHCRWRSCPCASRSCAGSTFSGSYTWLDNPHIGSHPLHHHHCPWLSIFITSIINYTPVSTIYQI